MRAARVAVALAGAAVLACAAPAARAQAPQAGVDAPAPAPAATLPDPVPDSPPDSLPDSLPAVAPATPAPDAAPGPVAPVSATGPGEPPSAAKDPVPAAPVFVPEAPMQERYFEVDGSRLNFLWRPLAVGPPAPDTPLKPDSALNTSWLLHRHLARGEIVEAAVLSNAPRRRFEELMRYRDSVGEAAFRQVFGEYFSSDNKPVAEAAMGEYRLIVWYLGKAGALAGEYFVEVEGRYMIDDGPGETRSRLRRVLESLRAGQLPAVAASTGTTTDNISK